MPIKSITAHEAKPGTYILVDGVACVVKSQDISKTGKHGSSKARIEAVGVIDDKKRVILKPGHEKFDVPLIEKKKGQVLSIEGDNANLMDIESFETFTLTIPAELKASVNEGMQIEYWNVEGVKVIKRTL